MKLNKKMSLGITLASMILLLTISLVNAQPVLIGSSVQPNPFDSRPQLYTYTNLIENMPALMYNGKLDIPDSFSMSENNITGSVELYSWRKPATLWTPIGWVDIKIKYNAPPRQVDDTYSIEYSVTGSDWVPLQADTKDPFDYAEPSAAQVASWAEIAEPLDGIWTWTDVGNLNVRFTVTPGADGISGTWDDTGTIPTYDTMYVYEVWATVWQTPLPPSASTTISVQPSKGVTVGATPAGKILFVEVFVQGVTNLVAYQIKVDFNTTVLSPATGLNWWSYYPFTDIAPSEFSDLGYASLAASIHINDPLAGIGVSGNVALARIYFKVDTGRTTIDYSWLTFSVSKISDPPGNKLAHTEYHGLYGTLPSGKYLLRTSSAFDVASPISTIWHEEYPVYSREYHQTSFTDQGIPGLNPSDQIDITNSTGTYWFHVDQLWSSDLGYDKYIYILATYKPGPIPEFPLGTGIVFLLAPVIPIVYLWRLRKRKVR